MKIKGVLTAVVLVLCILSALIINKPEKNVTVSPNTLSSVTINLSDTDSSSKVLQSRFLNMLNHNFVYGEDYLYVDKIFNLSTIALLDRADETKEFIDETVVLSYIYDMYGIKIEDASAFNSDFPQKDGYVYIIPQGFTVYKHSNAKYTQNEDGTYTVETTVSVEGHDGEIKNLTAKTLFVKNSASSFGFNIVYCEILDTALQM